jgi:glycosyltransferase involved in cell wall biosynthesis
VISVVIPSYNHRPYVGGAVRSALASVGVELEVVVVDDGSSDGSREFLTDLATTDPRVRVTLQDNRGAHAAIARGFELARGDVLAVLNSDDLYHPDRLLRCCDVLETGPEASAVATAIELIDDHGAVLGVKHLWRDLEPWPRQHPSDDLAALEDAELALLQSNWIATTSNLVFRRSALKLTSGLRPLRYCHDWDLALSLCRVGRMVALDEPLVHYRVHGHNTIREGTDDRRAQALMQLEILWVVANYAGAVIRRRSRNPAETADLRRRFWKSVPPFAGPHLLAKLIALRGTDRTAPAAYATLIDPGHPLRELWLDDLARMEPAVRDR